MPVPMQRQTVYRIKADPTAAEAALAAWGLWSIRSPDILVRTPRGALVSKSQKPKWGEGSLIPAGVAIISHMSFLQPSGMPVAPLLLE
jgi:hypothetical protein